MKTNNLNLRSSRMRALNENKYRSGFLSSVVSSISASVDTEKFNVILENSGENKAGVIFAIKELTGMGTIESKRLADSTPITILTGVSEDVANEAKKKLEDAGAVVVIITDKFNVIITDKFNVILENSGENKVGVIFVIRELRTDLDLQKAKELADYPPSTILTGVSEDVANKAKKKLEAIGGATVSVKPVSTKT